MLPILDSRYLYTAADFWCRGASLFSPGFEVLANFFGEPKMPNQYQLNPFLLNSRRGASAGFRLMQRLTQTYKKPAFGIGTTEIDGASVAVNEEVVFQTPFCNLLHFKKDGQFPQPRLLMLAPMAGHYATLLRETVRDSLPFFDVYVSDWANARDVPISSGAFDLDGYIATLIRIFEYLGQDFHVLSICQSGFPSLVAVALLEDNKNLHGFLPRSLIMMGSPIDTRVSATSVDTYATRHGEDWLEQTALSIVPEGYRGARRLVYPGFMQLAAFVSMHPERHEKSITDAVRHYIHGDFQDAEKISSFYAEYCSVMDLTAEFYLQTVRVVFQEALLAQGKMTTRGKKVDANAIRITPLMAVEGELDDICGLGQTKAALDITGSLNSDKKSYLMLPGTGHYGLFNGHRYRETVLPAIRKFTAAA